MNFFMSNSKDKHIEYIFTAYTTKKDGTQVYDKSYGKKAFRIPVTRNE